MFSSFLNPQPQRRSRSRSPGPRQSRETNDYHSTTDDERGQYRRSSKYDTDSDADLPPETPRYEERTPVDYEPRTSKDDRRRSRRPDEVEDDKRYSKQPSRRYADQALEDALAAKKTKSRRERDPGYAETPRSPRPNSAVYTNGDSQSYAAFPGNGNIPGGFPGQASSPQPSAYPRPKSGQYEDLGKFQYAKPDQNTIQYKYNNDSRQPSFSKAYEAVAAQPAKPSKPSASAQQKHYVDDRYARREPTRPKADREDSDDWARARQREVADQPRRESYHRERSPNPAGPTAEQLRKSLGRLSTGSAAGATLGAGMTPQATGARPPGSPLLEAYKGTYQTISPLPSPLALQARKKDDDLSDLDLSSDSDASDDELTRKIKALEKQKRRLKHLDTQDTISPRTSASKLDAPTRKSRVGSIMSNSSSRSGASGKKKGVSFYDPEADAEKIADALKGTHRSPDIKPLLKILPWLTTDEIIHLKSAYKNHAKINGQGINLSKHIKTRIPGNLGKILYATSLGQYESDAYWANCFYQSGASRRELLIESLIGRSNQQIREIKDVFKDKRYDDDLEKCMKAELKADKFRMAILLALEERRMPEGLGIDMRLVHEDGMDLYQALNSPGGESAMIRVILMRSDDHLREVLRYYEKSYRRNFARDMISKSQNLVGECLAHILNGALNRPMRDAILLHQAIDEFAPPPQSAYHGGRSPSPMPQKPTAGRAELLISRVIRLHWEPKHLERVKSEYEERYRESVIRAMARDVQGGMKTEEGKAWAAFAMDLIRSSEA
ncbi:hypothetical protein OHC33_008465 [Knufia fluminis]|uniref:Annexin ANXC4 n=1 Tax=Knufia fluminis TaxID=191047 RepID=A0AAN8I227_9EURO|nr:hypothetical protein OHC33_008465 [Knufia fluminis]